MRTILRYEVLIDDQAHEIADGPVVMVSEHRNGLPSRIEVWVMCLTDETYCPSDTRGVQVFGTGQSIPEHARWVGSCRADPYVWHLCEMP